MKIDAHHHFWRYSSAEFPWINGSMRALARDFLPEHLLRETAAAGVNGVVSVQARQSLDETRWLLDHAERHALIKGVVGWVGLESPGVQAELEALTGNKKLKGVRHVVQDEPDDQFILRDGFNRGVAMLAKLGLRYDILIYERHLPQAIQFVGRHPAQIFILDHMGKPDIRVGKISPWRRSLRELALRPNVYCKVSGLVTEADPRKWTEKQLRPYFDAALEAFGPRRLMFGSDWPVCLLGCDYARWHAIVAGWVGGLSSDEQARVLGGTAVEAYGL